MVQTLKNSPDNVLTMLFCFDNGAVRSSDPSGLEDRADFMFLVFLVLLYQLIHCFNNKNTKNLVFDRSRRLEGVRSSYLNCNRSMVSSFFFVGFQSSRNNIMRTFWINVFLLNSKCLDAITFQTQQLFSSCVTDDW